MNVITKNSGDVQGVIPLKIKKLPKLKFDDSQTNKKRIKQLANWRDNELNYGKSPRNKKNQKTE